VRGAALNRDIAGIQELGLCVEDEFELPGHNHDEIQTWSGVARIREAGGPSQKPANRAARRSAVTTSPIGCRLKRTHQRGRKLSHNPEIRALRSIALASRVKERLLGLDVRSALRVDTSDHSPAYLKKLRRCAWRLCLPILVHCTKRPSCKQGVEGGEADTKDTTPLDASGRVPEDHC